MLQNASCFSAGLLVSGVVVCQLAALALPGLCKYVSRAWSGFPPEGGKVARIAPDGGLLGFSKGYRLACHLPSVPSLSQDRSATGGPAVKRAARTHRVDGKGPTVASFRAVESRAAAWQAACQRCLFGAGAGTPTATNRGVLDDSAIL